MWCLFHIDTDAYAQIGVFALLCVYERVCSCMS